MGDRFEPLDHCLINILVEIKFIACKVVLTLYSRAVKANYSIAITFFKLKNQEVVQIGHYYYNKYY